MSFSCLQYDKDFIIKSIVQVNNFYKSLRSSSNPSANPKFALKFLPSTYLENILRTWLVTLHHHWYKYFSIQVSIKEIRSVFDYFSISDLEREKNVWIQNWVAYQTQYRQKTPSQIPSQGSPSKVVILFDCVLEISWLLVKLKKGESYLKLVKLPVKRSNVWMAALMCTNGVFIIRIFSSVFLKETCSKYHISLNDRIVLKFSCWSITVRNFEYLKAQENFVDKENRKFNLKQFRKTSIRKIFDSLHGISEESIPLSNAVEIMAYCLFDGKVEQDSVFETNLYNELVAQLKEMKDGWRFELETCSYQWSSREKVFNMWSIFQNEHWH